MVDDWLLSDVFQNGLKFKVKFILESFFKNSYGVGPNKRLIIPGMRDNLVFLYIYIYIWLSSEFFCLIIKNDSGLWL